MKRAMIVVCLAAAMLFTSLVLGPRAASAGSKGSTLTGVWGELIDLQLDSPRNRLYVSDSSQFNTEGVAVVNLDTHEETARVPIPDPTGLALSPSGSKLAVGSTGGALYIVDPATLTVNGSVTLTEPPLTSAQAWDVVFDGENSVVVSLRSPSVGIVPALIVNLTSMQQEGRIDESPYGFQSQASVRVDSTRRLLYVIERGSVWQYNLTTSPPTRTAHVTDLNFTTSAALSMNGQLLFFSSGRVYDAPSLTYIENIPGGDVALHEFAGRVYFAYGNSIDAVSLGGYVQIATYRFAGLLSPQDELVSAFVVDGPNAVGYVTTGSVTNDRSLRAVPLTSAIVDPVPPDGAVVTSATYRFSATLSGNIDSMDAHVFLDGVEMPPFFDGGDFSFGYAPGGAIEDGRHTALITAIDASSQSVRLQWQFTIDTTPPEITIDPYELLYTTSSATITGRITDLTNVTAQANGDNLTVDPVTGAFSYTLSLTEGVNLVSIYATGGEGLQSHRDVALLRLSSTSRYVNGGARFSISYPSGWTAQTDVTIQGTTVDALIQSPLIGAMSMNLNVIETGPQRSYTQDFLMSEAQGLVDNLTQPGIVYMVDEPENVTIPGVLAVTYSFAYWSQSLYQRQYLIVNADAKDSWVLTFTCASGTREVCDAYFKWMASTFAVEPAPVTGLSLLVIILIGAIIGAVAAGLATFLLLRRGRAKTQPTYPMQAPPYMQGVPGQAPGTPPAWPPPQQPPPQQPPGGPPNIG